jgi:dienelactone hydrolase
MKRKFIIYTVALLVFTSCNDEKKQDEPKEMKLKEETVSYTADSVNMAGYLVYDENKEGKRPAIVVVHEWWGLTDYPKMRARELAKLGYVAFAVDMYGNGQTTDSVATAQALSGQFYSNPSKAKTRYDAAFAKLMEHPMTDTTKTAAIGYCFGGTVVLHLANLGENLDGVVSFHGGLQGVPANKDLLKAKILVCHGGADPFVPQADVDRFKAQMDSIGADYEFKVYEGASHAFTNPAATDIGKKAGIPIAYNAAADTASWNDMKTFLNRILK